MSRRVSLPGAAELFRVTGPDNEPTTTPQPEPAAAPAEDVQRPTTDIAERRARGESDGSRHDPAPAAYDDVDAPYAVDRDEDQQARRPVVRRRRATADRRPTGRERHDEKITVYVSAEELIDLEQARLTLRGEFGLAVDRGRIVREAVALVLADLDAKGESSILVRRLRGR